MDVPPIHIPSSLGRDSLIRLALSCLEKANLSSAAIAAIETTIEDDAAFVCDVCERADCAGCDEEPEDVDAGADEEPLGDMDYPDECEAW